MHASCAIASSSSVVTPGTTAGAISSSTSRAARPAARMRSTNSPGGNDGTNAPARSRYGGRRDVGRHRRARARSGRPGSACRRPVDGERAGCRPVRSLSRRRPRRRFCWRFVTAFPSRPVRAHGRAACQSRLRPEASLYRFPDLVTRASRGGAVVTTSWLTREGRAARRRPQGHGDLRRRADRQGRDGRRVRRPGDGTARSSTASTTTAARTRSRSTPSCTS